MARAAWPWLAALALALALPPPVAAADVAAGRRLAQAQCGVCHAVGRTGASANPLSPPFRNLAARYPLSDLEEALAEGITVGHSGMPEFVFSPRQIDDLLAYMRSLRRR
jgi:mono/diheme cytochrome c family protein